MNFSDKKIHMLGVKGTGMTALAEILHNMGAKITGSDTKEEFHTDAVLRRLNIRPLDFSPSNIAPDLDLVIYSSAYAKNHSERKRAAKLGIKEASYAEALSAIFNQKRGIMVAGSHGKTTTTALLGHIMTSASFDPTVVVGGTVVAWNSNVKVGKSDWMIVEGDEYQEKFLNFKPHYLLITNIDYDHPDTFPDAKSYRKAFEKLAEQTSKKVFTSETIKPLNPETYKVFNSAYFIGEHNRANLALILASCRQLGITDEQIKTGLSEFRGVRRRMEIYLQSENIALIDDYAHHPAEISATLKAIKGQWPKRKIAVIFQPHTFSRTKALINDFAQAFKEADEVYLTPTYSSAREAKEDGETADKMLYENVRKFNKYCFKGLPSEEKILKRNGAWVIVTMGAGDLWQFARKLSFLYGK